VAAILLHAVFNYVSQAGIFGSAVKVPLQVGIGLAGVGLIAFFISLGLREERRWFVETLDRTMGVTGAEVRAAQAYATIDEVLRPIAEQFPDQTERVETLLLQQAQMGIKRKVQQEVDDTKLQEKLGKKIAHLKAEMEQLRREIGPYIMVYIRSVFPEGLLDVWSKLELLVARSGPADAQRWADMLRGGTSAAPARDIFGRLREEEGSNREDDGAS
jgi:hypothetical protein